VVVGKGTWERVRGRFACRPLEAARLKGKQQTVHPYLVEGRLPS